MSDLPVPNDTSSDALLQLFWHRLNGSRQVSDTDARTPSQLAAARRIVLAVGPSPKAIELAATFADMFFLDLSRLADAVEHPAQKILAVTSQPSIGRAIVAATALQYGQDQQHQGNLSLAGRYFRWAVQQFHALNERQAESNALLLLGRVAQMQERFDEADQCYHQALAIDQASGDTFDAGVDVALLGQVAWLAGRLDEADALCRQALALHRRAGDRRNVASTLATLGQVARERGQRGQETVYVWLSAVAKAWPRCGLWLASLVERR
jgi:tetratricopeptide (TPR) repeat protein